jgi:O-antigen ligase
VALLVLAIAFITVAAENDTYRLLLLALFIPFDLQREVSSHWLYLDSVFILTAIPLLRKKTIRHETLLVLAYIAFIVISTATRSLNGLWFWGFISRLVAAWLFTNAVAISKLREWGILALGSSLPVLTLLGCWQIVTGEFGSVFEFVNPHMMAQPWLDRAFSTLWHPNAFGGFSALVTCAVLALALNGVRPKLSFTLSAFGALGVITSGSRGALVALVLSAILVISVSRKVGRVLVITMIVTALFVPMVSSFNPLPLQRMGEVDSFTTETRLYLYFLAFQMFQQHPMVGVGTMNFQELLSDSAWGAQGLNLANTHNLYLQILSENGLIGFVLAAGPFIWLSRRFWLQRRKPVALAGLAALVCVAVNGTVDFLLVHPQYLLALGTIVGCALGESPDELLS